MFKSLFKTGPSSGGKEGGNKSANPKNKEQSTYVQPTDTPSLTTSSKGKKKRKRPPKKRPNDDDDVQQHRKRKQKLPPSEKAIALSAELKSLSTQKRLQDALDVYYDEANNNIRDEYHACIVIDCCSRCGNIQEGIKIVKALKEKGHDINVQTKTALLKGYVHSGMMREASLLYQEMNMEKKMRDRPNVRTLNTLLRGCLWSAATCYHDSDKDMKKFDVHGGVVTSELIWPKPNGKSSTNSSQNDTIQPDLSSFEYSIILLCQTLRIKEAKERVNLLRSIYGIQSRNEGDDKRYKFDATDPTSLETLCVAYISLSRACALLEKRSCAKMYAAMVISLAQQMLGYDDDTSTSRSSFTNNKKITGGKRSWKKSNNESGNKHVNQQQESRRDVSNKLFRGHRVNEMQSEAKMILNLCNEESKQDRIDLPFYLATRLLYFSGGGTTDLSALHLNDGSKNGKIDGHIHDSLMTQLHSLWFSFGLAQAVRVKFPELKLNVRSGHLLKIEDGNRIAETINVDMNKILLDKGSINFDQVFSLHNQKQITKDRPLYIELGSGFGEWAVYQAQSNPSCDYVAVELRADRVSQMFTKAMLNDSGPLSNICSIGAECGHLLRHRIPQGSVSKIFINHPEPPTQTFGSNFSVIQDIADGGEEPAHMLNSETLLSATKCLKESTGELIIVTDNRWYAKLICSTLLKLMTSNEKHGLSNKVFNEHGGIQQVDSFSNRQERVNLYEGKPNKAIGHFVPNDGDGNSYFDRLWKSGAGTHAETKRRFIIAMCKSPASRSISSNRSHTFDRRNQSTKRKNKSRKTKKRDPEKQKRRNEKRLLKKKTSTAATV